MKADMNQLVRDRFDKEEVDVLYTTSDDQIFLAPEDAAKVAKGLDDQKIIPHYRDPEVRKWAEQNIEFQKVVWTTDYLKMIKQRNGVFSYDIYKKYAKIFSVEPISLEMFNFIASKVFTSTRPTTTGQRDTIFSWRYGFVKAAFVRRYKQGIVWQYADEIILTCPTNTELSYIDMRELFKAILTEEKVPK